MVVIALLFAAILAFVAIICQELTKPKPIPVKAKRTALPRFGGFRRG